MDTRVSRSPPTLRHSHDQWVDVPAAVAAAKPWRLRVMLASVWCKAVVFLIGLEVLSLAVTRGSWLWEVPGEFYASIDFIWAETHQVSRGLRAIRTDATAGPLVLIVGSSFVIYDVDEQLVRAQLQQAGTNDVQVVKLGVGGAPATDIERIIRSIDPGRHGVLIYITAPRDYPNKKDFDPRSTPLANVLHPRDRWFPDWRRHDVTTFLDDLLSQYFDLYRCRTFVRLRLLWEGQRLARAVGFHRLGPHSRRQPPDDADGQTPFERFRGAEPISFESYLRWVHTVKENPTRYLASQKAINPTNYGVAGNKQVPALENVLRIGVRSGLRPVLISPPVNPLVRSGTTPYYDRGLGDTYMSLFERLAIRAGGLAVDWRGKGDVDQFADFNHLNGRGRSALSLQLAELVHAQLAADPAAVSERRKDPDSSVGARDKLP